MKTRLFNTMLAITLALIALPMMGQDFMNVFFKYGYSTKFFLDKIVEMSTTRVDADGVSYSDYKFQHIVTVNGEYFFDLSEIDSITFTKISKEQLDNNYKKALEVILPALSECETAADAKNQLEKIKKSENVENAWCDDFNCFVKIKDGETISFHFSHVTNDADADMARSVEKKKSIQRFVNKIGIKTNDERPKVVIINQQHKDESRKENITKYFDPLEKDLESVGIETDRIDSLTINFFYRPENKSELQTIFDYDLIFLVTHGNYDGKKHNTLLSTELGMEKKKLLGGWSSNLEDICNKNLSVYRDTVLNGLISDIDCVTVGYNDEKRNGDTYWVGYVNLSEDFFSLKAKAKFANPKSILFNGACQSLEVNNSFAETLFSKQNLGVYLGYNETNFLSQQTGFEWFQSLLSGKSVRKAWDDLPEGHKIESGSLLNIPSWNYVNAELKIGTNKKEYNELFLFPTYTKQIDPTVAQTAFDTSKSVVVEGLTLTLDHNAISCGFEYGPKYDQSWKRIKSTNIIPLTTITDKGNVLFRAELSDLKPGNTYYYRAYTDDGMNYNYGNIDSLTIYEPMTLSAETVLLNVGESSMIQITSGSGSYSVENVTPQDIVTAEISENCISIEANKAGTATITIKDTKSRQTTSFTVTVNDSTPIDIPANAINLGLPSGTLWASYNVGATKQEEYGDYYAWGETEQKEKCGWKNYSHCNGTEDTCFDLGSDISGTKYDVAHAKWGGNWQLPTLDQVKELIDKCTSTWTKVSGVNGLLFTGPNGKTVFFPAAGYLGSEVSNSGSYGYYWSSGQDPKNAERAYNLSVQNGDPDWLNNYRYAGFSVRPVISGLELSTTGTLNIFEGDSKTITIKSGSGSYQPEVDKVGIVSVSISGTTITISGQKVGDAIVTVTDTNSGQIANIIVIVKALPKAIDLGLPSGTKWASFNIGANKPEEYGEYYAWGETETKSWYGWDTYSHCDGTKESCHDIGLEISGTKYDVAHVKWGGNWQMPTSGQIKELINNCKHEITSYNGVTGTLVTGPNGNTIFLPCAGFMSGKTLYGPDKYGLYKSGSRCGEDDLQESWLLNADADGFVRVGIWNCTGHTVRPVFLPN